MNNFKKNHETVVSPYHMMYRKLAGGALLQVYKTKVCSTRINILQLSCRIPVTARYKTAKK